MAFVKKFKYVFMVVGLMVFEGAGLMLLLPSQGPKVHADDRHAEAEQAQGGHGKALHEVELGEFKVDNITNPAAMLRIECRVYCTVLPEGDKADAGHGAKGGAAPKPPAYQKKQFRIKEAVQAVFRSAGSEYLQEPNLASIKRQIHAAVSEVLGSEKPQVQAIIIPDFKVTEL